MIVVQRLIQQVYSDKWAKLEAIDKKFNAVEARLGFPPKKRYRCLVGGHNEDTLIVERQWESLATLEAAYDTALADPGWQALGAEMVSDGPESPEPRPSLVPCGAIYTRPTSMNVDGNGM